MKLSKIVLRLAALALGLAAIHTATTPVHAAFGTCRNFAVFCSGPSSAGHCGYKPGEVCTSCYATNGDVISNVCPPGGGL